MTFVSTQETSDIIAKVNQRDNKKSGLELRLYFSGMSFILVGFVFIIVGTWLFTLTGLDLLSCTECTGQFFLP